MNASPPIAALPPWESVVAILTALGLGGVLTALFNRPSRKNEDAKAAKDHATGGAAVITATASAFTEVTSGLREEIERLQQDAGRLQADLANAHVRAVDLEAKVKELTADLERERAEKLAAQERVELLTGEVRQLQQVLASTGRGGARE